MAPPQDLPTERGLPLPLCGLQEWLTYVSPTAVRPQNSDTVGPNGSPTGE